MSIQLSGPWRKRYSKICTAYIRPKLEYAPPDSLPHFKGHLDLLERVQPRALELLANTVLKELSYRERPVVKELSYRERAAATDLPLMRKRGGHLET